MDGPGVRVGSFVLRAPAGLAIVALLVGLLSVPPGVASAPSFAAPPAPSAHGPSAPAATRTADLVTAPASPHPSSSPPPPPYDWDQMWFNAPNASGLAAAAGGGAQIAVNDPGGFAIMYGGATARAGISNATWLVNETTAVWSELSTPVAPPPRTDFSLASGAGCGVAVLFGGEVNATSREDTNDTWLFNYSTLTWTNITGPVGPAPRQGAALAVDDATCQAVLFGGSDAAYASGNSTGSVQWNDTWVLSLATRTWVPLAAVNAPPSLTDSGFLYDNETNYFLLYGGCEGLCSASLWRFDLGNATWSLLPAAAVAPPGRGGADWVYGWTHDVAVLSMGYQLEGTAKIALNDTYIYEIGNNRWDSVGAPTPTPRYYAPAGWLGSNGCPGMVLLGGALAPTDPPDQWFLDEAPDLSLQCNTWGNDSISTGGQGQGYGCDFGFYVVVNVTNAVTGAPIEGANVSATGNCSRAWQNTDGTGESYFDLAYAPYTITATDPGFHANSTAYFPSVNGTIGLVRLTLLPLPTLEIATYARGLVGPPVPLPNVTLYSTGQVLLGMSNATGIFVDVGYEPLGTVASFEGVAAGYGSASNDSLIPSSGLWWVNLTLLDPGPVDVRVVEEGTGVPLPAAIVDVANLPGTPTGGFRAATDPTGWANASVDAGNYTAAASLPGFAPIENPAPFYHPWDAVTVVTINLTSNTGYTVDVEVLNNRTSAPVPNANVQIGLFPLQVTGPAGWTNRSDIRPAGAYAVAAWAANFSTARTTVLLSYARPSWVVVFRLNPLANCSEGATNCTRVPNGTGAPGTLSLWPASGPSLPIVAGGGALLFLVPALALLASRRRTPTGPRPPEGR